MIQLPIIQKFLIVINNTSFSIDFLDDRIHYYEDDYDMMNLYRFMRKIINSHSDQFKFYDFHSEQFDVTFNFDNDNIILNCLLSSYDRKSFELKYSYDEFSELFLGNESFSKQIHIYFNSYIKSSFDTFLKEEMEKKFQQFSDRFIFEQLQNLNN